VPKQTLQNLAVGALNRRSLLKLSAGLFVAAGLVGIGPSTGAQSLLQAKSPDAYRGRVFGALGMITGLCLLIGTITAGFLTDHLGVVTVLNIQAAGYVFGGLLIIVLLPRKKETAISPEEPEIADQPSMEPERI